MIVVDYLRKILTKIDLLLVEADAELHTIQARTNRYRNSHKKSNKEKFIIYSLEEEKQLLFIKDLLKAREELLHNVNVILSRYEEPTKNVFFDFFIKNEPKEKVAPRYNLGDYEFDLIVDRLKIDLDYFFE